MQFDTFLFGKIDVAPESILTFPDGLLAFAECKRFTLVHERADAEAPTTFTLQSLDDPTVAFLIADPTAYGFHYELELSDEEIATLKVDDPNDVAVMLVLFRRENKPDPIEANIRAPILINAKTRLAMQKVIKQVTPRITLSELSQPIA